MGVSGSGDGDGGDVAVGGDAEVDVLGAAGCGAVGLGEFAGGGGEADLESFGFAGPAFAFGFGDAGVEVVADLLQAVALGGVDSQEWAPDACLTCPMFVTTAEFLPQHHAERQATLQIISAAEAAGHARVAEMNRQVAGNLDKIIASLEDGGEDKEAAAGAS